MASDPDFDEMETTTLRNRGAMPRKAKRPSFGGRKASPFAKKAHMDRFEDYEGSPEDEAEDRAGAKRLGMTPDEYEGSPQDEAEDMEGMRSRPKPPSPKPFGGKPSVGDKGDKSGKGAHGMHVAIVISPMSNPAAEHRSSIRDSINKAVKTVKRRGGKGY